MKQLAAILLVIAACALPSAAANKFVFHMLGLPLIEGSGIYTDVMCLKDAGRSGTKAAAVTDLALLGTEATLGILSMAGVGDGKLTKVHRASAYLLTAAGIWLALQTSTDPNIKGSAAQITGIFHPALCTVPIIMFSF